MIKTAIQKGTIKARRDSDIKVPQERNPGIMEKILSLKSRKFNPRVIFRGFGGVIS